MGTLISFGEYFLRLHGTRNPEPCSLTIVLDECQSESATGGMSSPVTVVKYATPIEYALTRLDETVL